VFVVALVVLLWQMKLFGSRGKSLEAEQGEEGEPLFGMLIECEMQALSFQDLRVYSML
jgi:hypothetical protein